MTNAKSADRTSAGTRTKAERPEDVDAASNRPARLPSQPVPPPTVHPKFEMRDIRAAIPKHCFQRSLMHSMMYVIVDLAIVAACAYGASHIDALPVHDAIKWGMWAVYWLITGNVATGLWVIAHECGHQAFSTSKLANNLVGTVLHSALLVPYHPWRVSHGNHHKYCCSIEHDEVFSPAVRSQLAEAIEESPIAAALSLIRMLLFGWPAYLICNAAGPSKYQNRINDHFNPKSALFDTVHYWLVVQSDLAFFAALGLLGWCTYNFGLAAVACYYIVPYLIVNSNLVAITYLQHTDTYVPHYREGAFTSMRGKLSTVDRSFGILDLVWHHITDTHVLHHIDHCIPHYHAQEATEAIKELLGPYHLRDDTPFFAALYRSMTHCRCVPDDGDYVYFVGPKNDAKSD